MIETVALAKRYNGNVAVDGLTISVREGEVLGLLGPNGAGKTTTVRMLATLIAPTDGSATIAGHTLGREDAAIRASVGILTESPGLYEKLSAWRNLDFFGQLYGIERTVRYRRIEEYLTALDLWDFRTAPAGTFSKGMRQKLAIVRALLHEPKVLYLDEPTSGLDPESAKTVRQFVLELRKAGRTILLTTHNLEEADKLCDRIAILKQRLIRVDTAENLRHELFGNRIVIELVRVETALVDSLRNLPYVKNVVADESSLTVTLQNPEKDGPALVQAVIGAGGQVRRVDEERHTLEDVYLALLGGESK